MTTKKAATKKTPTKRPTKKATTTPIEEAPMRVVTQLAANGKTYDLYLNTLALDTYLRKSKDYGLGSDILSVGHFTALVYGGVYSYCVIKELKTIPAFEEVYEVIESLFQTTTGFNKLMEVYSQFLSIRPVRQFFTVFNANQETAK